MNETGNLLNKRLRFFFSCQFWLMWINGIANIESWERLDISEEFLSGWRRLFCRCLNFYFLLYYGCCSVDEISSINIYWSFEQLKWMKWMWMWPVHSLLRLIWDFFFGIWKIRFSLIIQRTTFIKYLSVNLIRLKAKHTLMDCLFFAWNFYGWQTETIHSSYSINNNSKSIAEKRERIIHGHEVWLSTDSWDKILANNVSGKSDVTRENDLTKNIKTITYLDIYIFNSIANY